MNNFEPSLLNKVRGLNNSQLEEFIIKIQFKAEQDILMDVMAAHDAAQAFPDLPTDEVAGSVIRRRGRSDRPKLEVNEISELVSLFK